MASIEDYAAVGLGAASQYIPELSPILSPLSQLYGAEGSSQRQWKYTKKAMDYQNQLAIQNWNLQNAYNAPTEQMKRLKAAGLNPHLVYGHGAQTLAAALTQPNAKSDAADTDALGAILATQTAAAQLKNMDEQNKNLKAQNELLHAQADKEGWSARREQTAFMLDQATWRSKMHQQAGETTRSQAEADRASSLAKIERINALWKDEFNIHDYAIIKQRLANLEQENKVMLADEALKIANEALAYSGVSLNKALAKKAIEDAKYTSQKAFIESFDANLVRNGIDPELDPEWRMLGNIVLGLIGLAKPGWKDALVKIMKATY